MTLALQIPTWPDPYDTVDFSNAYATMFGFTIEVTAAMYTVHIKVFADIAAFQAGKQPVADIIYRSKIGSGETWDGVFPDFNTAITDPNFVVPLLNLRDWVYTTIKANDARFAGATDL